MSQSKFSSPENEKTFVIRHSFENVMNLKDGEEWIGPVEKHFNVPWKIRIRQEYGYLKVFLDCMLPTDETADWSIDTHTAGKLIRQGDEVEYRNVSINFNTRDTNVFYMSHNESEIAAILNDGCYVFEFTVIILNTTGVHLEVHRSRIFDDDAAKETSDVTLIVKDRKFHVLKMYLAAHSAYFKALFCGKLAEAGKSEIELKDVDPDHFQHFLEFLYAGSFIEAHSVLGILHLADFFDSKTVVKRCQEFLVEKSNLPLHRKFETAIKYNLEELKTKCISELNTVADIRSIAASENSDGFDAKVWKKLCTKLLAMVPN